MTDNLITLNKPLSTAVLFIVFRRIDTTIKVFEAIRRAKPPRLYIAADGHRKEAAGEEDKVREVRDYVLANIDWNCEVKTLFREKNLGMKLSESEAMNWFFENEKMGIILEDDCLPSQSFFRFCEELLKKYEDEERVMQISGSCFLNNIKIRDSYYFSRNIHCWGWASWQDKWAKYTMDAPNYEFDFLQMANIFNTKKEMSYWNGIFKNVFAGNIDTWDYQWVFSIWKHNGFSIYPFVNMVKNIGFRDDATYTTICNRKIAAIMKKDPGEVDKIIHPINLEENRKFDSLNFKVVYSKPDIMVSILNKSKIILMKIKNYHYNFHLRFK